MYIHRYTPFRVRIQIQIQNKKLQYTFFVQIQIHIQIQILSLNIRPCTMCVVKISQIFVFLKKEQNPPAYNLADWESFQMIRGLSSNHSVQMIGGCHLIIPDDPLDHSLGNTQLIRLFLCNYRLIHTIQTTHT
jgi:hypothetical protein